jgi:hypothetical protein
VAIGLARHFINLSVVHELKVKNAKTVAFDSIPHEALTLIFSGL